MKIESPRTSQPHPRSHLPQYSYIIIFLLVYINKFANLSFYSIKENFCIVESYIVWCVWMRKWLWNKFIGNLGWLGNLREFRAILGIIAISAISDRFNSLGRQRAGIRLAMEFQARESMRHDRRYAHVPNCRINIESLAGQETNES